MSTGTGSSTPDRSYYSSELSDLHSVRDRRCSPLNENDARDLADQCSEPSIKRCWGISKLEVARFEYKWTIRQFSLQVERLHRRLQSPSFFVGKTEQLELFLEMKYGHHDRDLSLQLVVESSAILGDILIDFQFSILNRDDAKCNLVRSDRALRFRGGKGRGYSDFISIDFLMNKSNNLLVDDSLTILCEGTAIVDKVSVAGCAPETPIKFHSCNLSQDLGAILASGLNYDTTLIVGGRELLVHKAILTARSSVFASMFTHKMTESKENRVLIEDIRFDIAQEMISYIYTGRLNSLEKIADSLLVAADKYNLVELKTMCEDHLSSTITVENAADLLVLADLHSAQKLKVQVLHFIDCWASDVAEMTNWKNLQSTHPHLVIEAFNSLAFAWSK